MQDLACRLDGVGQDLAGRLDGVGQDLAGRVDGVGQASSARFDVVDGGVQQLAGALGENRKQGDEALRRLGRLDSALEETGRRVELSRKPGEEAVELLRSTAKVSRRSLFEFDVRAFLSLQKALKRSFGYQRL